jgi:nucleoside-diphosphate-sugar epimerase
MILVTGGTGLVGAHLLFHLLQNDFKVRAIHREKSDLQNVEKVFGYYHENHKSLFQKIEWLVADLNDLPALEKAFEGVEQVYHAAAMISFDPNDYDQLVKINTEGTSNMVNLCIAKRVKKLCYVSTIGTIGRSTHDEMVDEQSEWQNHHINVYAKAKYAAEMEVWRGGQEGLSVVMVNPGVIIGPGFWKKGTGALFKAAHKGYRYYPPGGTGFVTVHDVVKVMVLLMNSEIKNERYIMVAENLTFKEVLSDMSTYMGKKPPTKQLQFWQLEIGRVLDALRHFFTKSRRRITKNSIYSLKHRDAYDHSKIKKTLDFEFEPIAPVLKYSCEKFIEENH